MVRHSQIQQIGKKAFGRGFYLSFAIALLLSLFAVLCRCFTPLADFYAISLYPFVSSALSLLSAFSPVNLEEIAIVLLTIAIVGTVILACLRKIRWIQCLGYLLSMLLWTYAWFYCGWCINYSRSSLYARASVAPTLYDEEAFRSFATAFVADMNNAWTSERYSNQEELESIVKTFYADVPAPYGLATPRSWHHPKRTLVNSLYSSVGIQGFMAPLFAESCINSDVLSVDYPFVYAHEYAHLMGVSSEAEANWWAYHACLSSGNTAIRYSGYKGILSHLIRNARTCLSEEEYKEWFLTIRPEIIEDLAAGQDHWKSLLSPRLNRIQEAAYDSFLKSNQVSAGTKDYSRVIKLLIDIPYSTGSF